MPLVSEPHPPVIDLHGDCFTVLLEDSDLQSEAASLQQHSCENMKSFVAGVGVVLCCLELIQKQSLSKRYIFLCRRDTTSAFSDLSHVVPLTELSDTVSKFKKIELSWLSGAIDVSCTMYVRYITVN